MLRSEMQKSMMILSINYSKRCKLFVFPKEFIKDNWFRSLNMVVIKEPNQKVELYFFLVMKLTMPDEMDHIPLQQLFASPEAQAIALRKPLGASLNQPSGSQMGDSKADRAQLKVLDKNKKTSKGTKKGLDFEDVTLNFTVNKGLHSKNRLNMLFTGQSATVAATSVDVEGFVDTYPEELEAGQALKLTTEKDFGVSTPQRKKNSSDFINPGQNMLEMQPVAPPSEGTYQKAFPKGLNSDQKLFMNRYDELDLQIGVGEIMDVEPTFENEAELRFSEEGNHSPSRLRDPAANPDYYGPRTFHPEENYDDYADGFGTTLEEGMNDYDPMNAVRLARPRMAGYHPSHFEMGPGMVPMDIQGRKPYNPQQRYSARKQPPPPLQQVAYGKPFKHQPYASREPVNYDDILETNPDPMEQDNLE